MGKYLFVDCSIIRNKFLMYDALQVKRLSIQFSPSKNPARTSQLPVTMVISSWRTVTYFGDHAANTRICDL
jgi:hypothetical protein